MRMVEKTCPNCGTPLELAEGVVKKATNPYEEDVLGKFYECPNCLYQEDLPEKEYAEDDDLDTDDDFV